MKYRFCLGHVKSVCDDKDDDDADDDGDDDYISNPPTLWQWGVAHSEI